MKNYVLNVNSAADRKPMICVTSSGLSLRSQELSAIFLGIRLFCRCVGIAACLATQILLWLTYHNAV